MNLYIDIGNSRIKWKILPETDNAVTQSFCYNVTNIISLMEGSFSILENTQLQHVYISNVAGDEIESKVARWFADSMNIQPQFAVSSGKTQHLINTYTQPESLGVDRLLAMLAASKTNSKPCVIADCGTATTIDCVSEANIFLGGIIIPGVGLMQSILSKNTNALTSNSISQEVASFATNTESAVFSGAILATTKAIENSMRELTQFTGLEAQCIVTGGNGEMIKSYLECAATVRADLVLEGLFIYF